MQRSISRKWLRRTGVFMLCLLVLMALAAVVCNSVVESQTARFTFDAVDQVPFQRVGLVLGTSKQVRSGQSNLYFKYRMDAAEALFKQGKVEHLVLSGDNGSINYNEPVDMKNELLKRGIPEDRIHLDYAGFRTFDSVYRMEAIFGQKAFTIISQEFHTQRAVYIAQSLGLRAIGFNARNVGASGGMKTRLREYLARVRVILDLWLGAKPRFLGERIVIPA
jgi:SanA protein